MKLARVALKTAWRLRQSLGTAHPHYLIACMPKSASTFISNALSVLTGLPKETLAAAEESEQDLSLPVLIDHYSKGTVSQNHVRGTEPNLRLMRQFGIRPIVLVRNLFDVVVSLRDHFDHESIVVPYVFWNEDYARMGDSEKIDAIIDLALPWYFNFYVSWYEATRARRIDCQWVTYEEFVQDPTGTMARITAFLGIGASEAALTQAIEHVPKTSSRVNRGVAGRGASTLSPQQAERVRSFARHYPSVDFSRVGLPGRGGAGGNLA